VFGDGDVAPLVALLADRELLQRVVDTNGTVWRTGIDDLASVTAALREPWPGVLVMRSYRIDATSGYTYGPMVDPEFARFVWSRFTTVRSYPRRGDPHEYVLLMVHNERVAEVGGAR